LVALLMAAGLCLLPLRAQAESLEQILAAGNAAYFQGDFKAAAAHYQRLLDAGVRDPDVYFNLATAQARLGALGRAILYFERADRLAPDDPETLSALGTARAALGKRRAEAQGEATIETRPPLRQALVQPYRENTLATWVLVLDLLFFGLLLARGVLRGDTLRAAAAMLAATCLLGLGTASAALAVKRGAFDEGQAAVVLRDGAELREGPDPRARARSRAHEGQSARVLRRDGRFARVRVAGGAEGWLQGSDVAVIAQD
jgi:tetratricopeptide (TPR) repeat protein